MGHSAFLCFKQSVWGVVLRERLEPAIMRQKL